MKCPQCPYYEQKTSYGVELIKCNNKCGKAETMTNEQAIKVLNMVEAHGSLVIQAKEMAIKALEQTRWIPLIKRPMTEEEREHYKAWSGIEEGEIFDCSLPENGQDVLVSYGGCVCVDTFCEDDWWSDFENVNIDDVQAWMPLPEPYKAESEDKA